MATAPLVVIVNLLFLRQLRGAHKFVVGSELSGACIIFKHIIQALGFQ